MALAGQPSRQRNGSHVWSVGAEQPLAADGSPLCPEPWIGHVRAEDADSADLALNFSAFFFLLVGFCYARAAAC